MPRFSYEDADKYGSSGGKGSFFQLKEDGDTALVHLLGNDMKDFPGYAVHKVPVGDKSRYVNCLRGAGEPIDVCPFCAEGRNDPEISKVHARVFVPMYNIDADEVQIWDRGKTFFRDLSSYLSHTPNASEVVTEIERKGKKGDTSTTYGLYEKRDAEDDGFDMNNVVDEIPEIMGNIVLDKTEEEMEYYLDHGEFPDGDASSNRDRRSRDKDDEKESRGRDREKRSESSFNSRRTPSRSRRREEDNY